VIDGTKLLFDAELSPMATGESIRTWLPFVFLSPSKQLKHFQTLPTLQMFPKVVAK
jgi:hypothetical protein